MAHPDLNLLITLEALLTEGSVTRAAKSLGLSPSAMSRALSRLRETTGDPLLVRAGRGLVPTPRAIALRDQVKQLVQDAETVLRPDQSHDMSGLVKTFTLRTSDGFVESFGASLIARCRDDAPGVKLNFLQKVDKESTLLRDGHVDLETGIIEGSLGPELRSQGLFRDKLVAVYRRGHQLSAVKLTAKRYNEAQHVIVSRSGHECDAVDLPFLPRNLERSVVTIVSGFSAALSIARASDLVATVPDRHTKNLRQGMLSVPLPMPTEAFTVSMLWHPRMDADPAHRWLRSKLREVCASK